MNIVLVIAGCSLIFVSLSVLFAPEVRIVGWKEFTKIGVLTLLYTSVIVLGAALIAFGIMK